MTHQKEDEKMSKILIVDDEKSIRVTLSAFLRGEGYEVEGAGDAMRALELLSQGSYDVVVSDIVLPRVSGVELLRQLREKDPEVQVIMMTGEPTLATAAEAVRSGASDYLTKPVGKAAILQSVGSAAKIKALEDDKRRLETEKLEYQRDLESLVEERTRKLRKALGTVRNAQAQVIKQERLSALGQMASGIAHDFNNVLMPIVGFSEMLISDPKALDDREETLRMLEMVRSAGEDAQHIVRRLRLVYKEEDDDYVLVNLARLLESAISILMPKWKEEMNAKGVTIEVLTEFEDVSLIKGNESDLREVFVNLILNAVDAMPDGGTLTCRLASENRHDAVVLELSDTGTGMTEEASSRCLEAFFTTKGMQGTGLGLSMVYGIVQRHGGDIEIHTEQGEGTTMRLLFPVPIDAEDIQEGQREEPEPLAPLRVLAIDDEARSRDLIASLLRADGHEAETAEGGDEGVEMFREGAFDLVITDRAMPLLSGDEVAARIAKDRPGTPVIMLTGFGDIMKDKDEVPEGVTFVMSKPVTRRDLRHVMTRVMSKASRGMISAKR
jgi:signal transduction histidine kinase